MSLRFEFPERLRKYGMEVVESIESHDMRRTLSLVLPVFSTVQRALGEEIKQVEPEFEKLRGTRISLSIKGYGGITLEMADAPDYIKIEPGVDEELPGMILELDAIKDILSRRTLNLLMLMGDGYVKKRNLGFDETSRQFIPMMKVFAPLLGNVIQDEKVIEAAEKAMSKLA